MRRRVAEEGSPPIVFDADRAIDVALRYHRELVAHQVSRRVFVEAAPHRIEAIPRDNGLTRSPEA